MQEKLNTGTLKNNYMKSNKDIIIEVLQMGLAGKLDPSVNFNPQFLADAIVKKLELSAPIDDFSSQRTVVKNKAFKEIEKLEKNMNTELKLLKMPEENLFANFLRGKITSYDEVKEILTKI